MPEFCVSNFIPILGLSVQGLKYSFQTSDQLCLVTEYIGGGDLLFHLNQREQFSEDHTRFYGAEITLRIQHIHQLGMIHRRIVVGFVCFLAVPQKILFHL